MTGKAEIRRRIKELEDTKVHSKQEHKDREAKIKKLLEHLWRACAF